MKRLTELFFNYYRSIYLNLSTEKDPETEKLAVVKQIEFKKGVVSSGGITVPHKFF